MVLRVCKDPRCLVQSRYSEIADGEVGFDERSPRALSRSSRLRMDEKHRRGEVATCKGIGGGRSYYPLPC